MSKINRIRITRSFKRVERMILDLERHGFDIEQMNIRIKIIDNIRVIFKVMPQQDKIIVKKILFQ